MQLSHACRVWPSSLKNSEQTRKTDLTEWATRPTRARVGTTIMRATASQNTPCSRITRVATIAGMPAKRTGHYGGSRPPGGHPYERLYRAVAKAISAESKAKGTTLEAVVAERFPEALPLVRKNGSKPPSLDC